MKRMLCGPRFFVVSIALQLGGVISLSLPTNSPTWKGICEGIAAVQDGFGWRLGNGKSISFWTDVWVGDTPLINYAIMDIPSTELSKKVSDYWFAFGDWDWASLSSMISDEALDLLRGQLVLGGVENRDNVLWKFSQTGVFSVASAYKFISTESLEIVDTGWNKIWKVTGWQRWRTLLWLVRRNCLLTNIAKFQRGLIHSRTCDICSWHDESTIHAVRDCSVTKNLWKSMVDVEFQDVFFSLPIQQWVDMNLANPPWARIENKGWDTFFCCSFGQNLVLAD